jgi:hypothetical protein
VNRQRRKKQGNNRKDETKNERHGRRRLAGKTSEQWLTEEQAVELGLLDLVAAVLELHVAGMCGEGRAVETTNRGLV